VTGFLPGSPHADSCLAHTIGRVMARAVRRVLGRLPSRSRDAFLEAAYRDVLGREIDAEGRQAYRAALAAGRSRSEVLLDLAASAEHREALALAARTQAQVGGDEDFLQAVFESLLGRPPDAQGRQALLEALAAGTPRADVVLGIARSEEYLHRAAVQQHWIADLRETRPERYDDVVDRDGTKISVFRAEGDDDFDWLEAAILENGYYEKPGVWGLTVDRDKRVMAEVIAAFAPGRALEIGCASGAVMKCLHDLGVGAEGVEISRMAKARAFPEIRDGIHLGDLLDLSLPPVYDLVYGLDIFEHLNPNKLDRYLAAVAGVLADGGYVFANIPAFGDDEHFGEVFPLYVQDWEADRAAGRVFRTLHVDGDGYPLNGHLVWADTAWWVDRFARAGLHREPTIERALHAKYDDYMREATPARCSYYVFTRHPDAARAAAIVDRITASASSAVSV
jgi:hypothetical protein